MKKNVLLIFGAESVEHDISIITALEAMANFDREIFNLIPVYISRKGVWQIADNLDDKNIYTDFEHKVKGLKNVTLDFGSKTLLVFKKKKLVKKINVDYALLCTHGKFGEDGSLQGALDCAYIPYSSSGVRSCALAMDKVYMKDIFKSRGISSVPYVSFLYDDYMQNQNKHLREIEKNLKYPVIIKPSNLGSSIGIRVCKSRKEFVEAIDFSSKFDKRILVEKYIESFDEYNCACLHINDDVKVSNVLKVKDKHDIYTFEDKYLNDRDKDNQAIDSNLKRKIQKLAKEVYNIFDCYGVVRVDFIYDKHADILYVNELNSIPGALAFYLFDDLSFKDILNCLIYESEKKTLQNEISTYESSALEMFEKLDITKK